MYRIVTIFFLLFFVQTTFAQIPNAGFENWTGGEPDGWWTSNEPGYINVTQSVTSHSGSKALRGEVISYGGGYVLLPNIQIGQQSVPGFAYNQRPVSFTGYYQFYPFSGSNDLFYLNVYLCKGGVDVAYATSFSLAAASSYTQFSIPFTYFSSEIPDTCKIDIVIMGFGVNAHEGSYFLLDDLAFSPSTGVKDYTTFLPEEIKLLQNYPNPFNPSTYIPFTLLKGGYVKIRVFNILGKEVATLLNGYKAQGKYVEKFNASNLASGVYFYRLDVENYSEMKQMLLIK
jgi:hypothetical protein